MEIYNPFISSLNNLFVHYKPAEQLEVKYNDVFGSNPVDLSYNFSRIDNNGVLESKPNTLEVEDYTQYLNNMNQLNNTIISNLNNEFSSVNKNLSSRVKQAVEFFEHKGLTSNQAKGIVGNLMHESGDSTLNTTTNVGDKGTSFGLALWRDPTKGKGRWTNLKNYAITLGKTEDDFEVQLNFVWKELLENPNWLKRLKATTTIEGATKLFMNDFERPNEQYAALKNRIKYAKSI